MRPWIIAHRGASAEAPENTLAAIKLAWQQGADAVEIDIRMTADQQVVAIHDATLLRTGGWDEPVAACDLDQIQRLDAGSWKGAAFAAERIPALRQVLATVPAGKRLVIEIKDDLSQQPALKQVLAQILHFGPVPAEQLVLICFDAATLHALHQAAPGAMALHLAGGESGEEVHTDRDLERLIQQAVAWGFQGLNLGQNWPIDRSRVERLHRAGLECWVWTVNEEGHAGFLADCGIDGLTTDRPGRIRDYLRLRQRGA